MKLKQIILGIFLIAIFLISSFPTNVEATSTTQDDWSGGPGQIIQNDETKFNQEEGEGLYIEDGLKMKINADTVVGQDNFDNTAPNSADPRSNGLYTPRSSIIINNKLFIIDTNNHRILIYNTIPTTDGVAADVVIGQTDFLTATSGTSSTKLKNPSGIYSDGTKLFVSDMSNNRILIYNTIPTTNGVAADVVIGQTDFLTATSGTSNLKLKNPYGIYSDGTKLFVTDMSNNRILIYNTIPTTNGVAADVVIGQTDFLTATSGTSNLKLKNPYGIYSDGTKLFVTDMSNNRILIYNTIPTTNGVAADVVIGQTDFLTATSGTSSTKLKYPSGIYSDGTKLFITDYSNNRILIYNTIPTTNGVAADVVIGQTDFLTATSGTSSTKLKYPSGIYSDGTKLFVSDMSNNRILIYNAIPTTNGVAADVVIGQTDFTLNGINIIGNIASQEGLNSPRNSIIINNKLFISDTFNNRILIYNTIPTTNGVAADVVIGQTDFLTATSGTSSSKLKNPSGIYSDGTKLFISDSNNHRILIYNTIPTTNGVAADVVIGQTDFITATSGTSATKLKYPAGIYSDGTKLFISDGSNHRILIYNTIPTTNGVAADVVIGQTDFITATSGTSATKLKYPAEIHSDGTKLFISDSTNNRLLIYNTIPTTNGASADVVIGQTDFVTATSGTSSTKMNYPYGIHFDGTELFIADYNNHRILIYNTIPTTNGASADVVIGQTDFLISTSGTSSSKMNYPAGIYSDGTKLFISDSNNNRIIIFNSNEVSSTLTSVRKK